MSSSLVLNNFSTAC